MARRRSSAPEARPADQSETIVREMIDILSLIVVGSLEADELIKGLAVQVPQS